jgi:hypothetical protein
MKDFRGRAIGHLLFVLFLLASGESMPAVRAQAALPTAPVTEYTNVPVSNRDLRRSVDKAQLIVAGQIAEYAANKDVENTVVVVTETYKGSAQPGERIRVQRICHHEAIPAPASFVGHRVILLLDGKPGAEPWRPASADSRFFFHPELRARILHILGRDAERQTRP